MDWVREDELFLSQEILRLTRSHLFVDTALAHTQLEAVTFFSHHKPVGISRTAAANELVPKHTVLGVRDVATGVVPESSVKRPFGSRVVETSGISGMAGNSQGGGGGGNGDMESLQRAQLQRKLQTEMVGSLVDQYSSVRKKRVDASLQTTELRQRTRTCSQALKELHDYISTDSDPNHNHNQNTQNTTQNTPTIIVNSIVDMDEPTDPNGTNKSKPKEENDATSHKQRGFSEMISTHAKLPDLGVFFHTENTLREARAGTELEFFGAQPHIEVPWGCAGLEMKGILEEQTPTKSWEEKLFILKDCWLLHYNPQDRLNEDHKIFHPKGVYHLHGAHVEHENEIGSDRLYCFRLTLWDSTDRVLSAGSRENEAKWMGAILLGSRVSTESCIELERALERQIEISQDALSIVDRVLAVQAKRLEDARNEEARARQQNEELKRFLANTKRAHGLLSVSVDAHLQGTGSQEK